LQQEPHELVREYATRALGRIGRAAAQAVPDLVRALASPDWGLRSEAARALGRIGPAAKAAVPALSAALEDEHEHVREAAREALASIDEGGAS
jgi:HEAT repeat protein